jgi:hypothetical protein
MGMMEFTSFPFRLALLPKPFYFLAPYYLGFFFGIVEDYLFAGFGPPYLASTPWYKKNMLPKDSMSDVDENVDENGSLGEDPIVSNDTKDDEVEHDPFEFSHMMKFHFLECCLIQRFGRFKGLMMAMQI